MSIVANSISQKKSGSIKIIFIWLSLLIRKTFSLRIISGRGFENIPPIGYIIDDVTPQFTDSLIVVNSH
jgi:hypothetical protein